MLCLLAAGFSSCSNLHRIRPSGNVVTEDRTAAEFTSVSVGSGLRLHIEIADEPFLQVKADDNIIQYIRTEISGGKLTVRVTDHIWFSGSPTLDVYARTPHVVSAEAGGAAQIIVDGTIAGNDFDISLGGASKMTGKLALDGMLKADLGGASSLDATVSCGDAKITLGGASRIRGTYSLEGDFRGDLGGASNADISGSCVEMQLKVGGASHFSGSGFRSAIADIDVGGASRVEVYASDELRVEAGGASRVTYFGNPEITKLESGGGSTIKKGD